MWQYSNPIAYADWFLAKVPAHVFEDALADLAKSEERSVEEVPRFMVRTPLQRLTQVIKRHRDVYFADDPGIKPSSILLTTLIAHSYEGGTDFLRAATDFLDAVPRLVRFEGGCWIVANPVEEKENFADKWNDHPERREAFLDWLRQLRIDLTEASGARGLRNVADLLNKSFGEAPVRNSMAAIGASLASTELLVEPTGRLTTNPEARPVPRNTFHGPDAPTP